MARQSTTSLAMTVREHDAALGGLIRANPLAILVVDAHDRVQMVNPAFEALFGFREAELVGHPIEAFIVPRDRAVEAAGLSQRRRKDGSVVDIDLTVVPLATGSETVGAYGIFRDLTEQKRAERQLRAQYAVVEALANSSTIESAASWVLRAVAEALHWQVGVMWIVDKTANELRCVDCWCAPEIDAAPFERETRLGRFAPGVGPGRTWAMARPSWISDVTSEPAFSRRAAALGVGLHAAFSLPLLLDNEVVGVLEFFTRSILESDDQILRMFAALGQQFGAFVGRTRAQEQIERFFTMSGDLLCIAGFDGYFTRINESWHRTLGYTTTELMSRPLIDLVHQEDREVTSAMFASLMRGMPIQAFENRYRCKDGAYRWLSWTATPKPDERLVYAVVHDATTRKRLEHQTLETLKMRNDFVSFVTHQLRTPLSGIRWMLELAGDTTNPAEKASYIGDAHESANRLIGLVNDLLDVSRLESGKLPVTIEPVRLREMTEAVVGEVATLVREKRHMLDVESIPDLPVAMLDGQLTRQVILNLVSNAIKYTPPGGRIAIRIGRENGSLRWSIQDNGIGVPPASQKRLFEKFFRAENAHTVDTEGTGLGLYLVRLIVERLGGRIACESEEGRGTIFYFMLPLAAGEVT